MRRALVPLLLACACSASPPPPPLPPAAPAASAERAPAPVTLELTGTRQATVLVRRKPDGGAAFEVPLGEAGEVIGAPDGGAYAVMGERVGWQSPTLSLARINAAGHVVWKVKGIAGRLVADGDRLLVFHQSLVVMNAADGTVTRTAALTKPVNDAAARDGVVVVADARGVTRLTADGHAAWSAAVGSFPVANPSTFEPRRSVAVGGGGTVLVSAGGADSALVAFDAEGRPLYQLGLRGYIRRIETRANGDFAVLMDSGAVTLIAPEGMVRREIATEDPPLPPEGVQVVDARTDANYRRGTSVQWTPTAAYRAHAERFQGTSFRDVTAVSASGPDDVWILAKLDKVPDAQGSPRLFHHDGRSWSELGDPAAGTDRIFPLGLARSPSGALLVIGGCGGYGGRQCMLERDGSGFRRRSDVDAALSGVTLTTYQAGPTYARSPGGREVFCIGRPPACFELGRSGATARPLPAGEGRTMPGDAGEGRPEDGTPVTFAGEVLWKARGWATGENDVWAMSGTRLLHWNGTAVDAREGPVGKLRGVWSSGRDDVWIAGAMGVVRFDGERFWHLVELPSDLRDASVTGSSRKDVWVYGKGGLWHVTPVPGAAPDLAGTPSPPPPPAAPSRPLRVAGADPSYHLERVELAVAGGPPLRSALSLAEGPGGVVWLHDGARLVELDGTATRVLYQAPKPERETCWSAPENDCEVCVACVAERPAPLVCQRCVAPTGAGEGAVLADEGLVRVAGGKAAVDQAAALPALSGAAASPSGAVWAVSLDGAPQAVLLGPNGLRLVTGLAPAAYADVSARTDDDVWLAGGLSNEGPEPEGEGTLVHFDGRRFTRYRAPDGALFAVAAAGPDEAWTVGRADGALHVIGGAVEAFHLERESGARLGVRLRTVACHAREAWLTGDEATLLHWDGQALLRVDTRAAGKRAALSALIAPGAKPGWVAGPSGIWRVVR